MKVLIDLLNLKVNLTVYTFKASYEYIRYCSLKMLRTRLKIKISQKTDIQTQKVFLILIMYQFAQMLYYNVANFHNNYYNKGKSELAVLCSCMTQITNAGMSS